MTERPFPEGLLDARPKRRGCLFWGFLILFILVLLLSGALVILGFYAVALAKRFTSPTAQPVPLYEERVGEYEAIRKKFADFDQAVQKGVRATLELTSDDLNALIARQDRLRRKVFTRIALDRLFLDLSLPLGKIPFLSGRYFNGKLGVKMILDGPPGIDGRLRLTPVVGTANDEAMPEGLLTIAIRFAEFSLRQAVSQNERLKEFLRAAKSLEVENGKVVLTR